MIKLIAPSPAAAGGCTQLKLSRVTRLVSRHYDAHLAEAGLKMNQYSLLSSVLKLQPVRPVDLAQVLNLTASTLTRTLKPMVAAGLLEVSSGPDARSHLISITEVGRSKRSEAYQMWRVAQESLLEKLSPAHSEALHAVLDITLQKLSKGTARGDG